MPPSYSGNNFFASSLSIIAAFILRAMGFASVDLPAAGGPNTIAARLF